MSPKDRTGSVNWLLDWLIDWLTSDASGEGVADQPARPAEAEADRLSWPSQGAQPLSWAHSTDSAGRGWEQLCCKAEWDGWCDCTTARSQGGSGCSATGTLFPAAAVTATGPFLQGTPTHCHALQALYINKFVTWAITRSRAFLLSYNWSGHAGCTLDCRPSIPMTWFQTR